MTPIQKQIADRLDGYVTPSAKDILSFVVMHSCGEATYQDFFAAGGPVLVAHVALAKDILDEARKGTP